MWECAQLVRICLAFAFAFATSGTLIEKELPCEPVPRRTTNDGTVQACASLLHCAPLSRAVDDKVRSVHRITLYSGGRGGGGRVVLFFSPGSVRGVVFPPGGLMRQFALGQDIVIRVRRPIDTIEPIHCCAGFKITRSNYSIEGMSNIFLWLPPRARQRNVRLSECM